MFVKKIIPAVFLCMLAAGVSTAAELQRITLREAIAKGAERNNVVRAANFQAESANYGAKAASLHYLPTITVEEVWTRSDVPVNTFMMKLNQGRFTNQDFDAAKLNNPAPVGDFRTAVTFEQPLLVPSAWAAARAARRGAEKQEAVSAQTRQNVAFQIFQFYLEVQKSHARLKAAEKAVEEAKESKRQAVARTAAGMGLKSDELRAVTQLAIMEQQKISAENNLSLSRMRLAIATGGEPGDEVEALEVVTLKNPEQKLQDLIGIARQERRDLNAAERGKEQAEASLLQVNAGFLPSVGAFGSWQMNDKDAPFGRDKDSWMAGVALRWNIFDGFRTINGSGQARASRAAANEMLEYTRKEISFQVNEAWLRRIEAVKRLEVAKSAVVAAEEAVRLLSKRFDNSLATMLELLDAQSALNQARANLVEGETGLLLATGSLYSSAGIFLKEIE